MTRPPHTRPVVGRARGPWVAARLPGAVVRAGAVLLLALAGLGFGAGSAAAEVTVLPERVDPAARDVTLTFRLTGSDRAERTASLQVFLPTGRPLVGVAASAPPGWTARLTTATLPVPAPTADGPVADVVTMIEWAPTGSPAPDAAASDPAAAGAVVDLPVRVALMPDGAGPVRFRVLRTGTDGRVEEWANSWPDGAPKPAHDALLIRLGNAPPPVVAAAHGDHHGEGAALADAPVTPAGPDAVAATLVTALLVAAAGTGLMVALARRQRRRFAEMSGTAVPGPENSRLDELAETATGSGAGSSR